MQEREKPGSYHTWAIYGLGWEMWVHQWQHCGCGARLVTDQSLWTHLTLHCSCLGARGVSCHPLKSLRASHLVLQVQGVAGAQWPAFWEPQSSCREVEWRLLQGRG